MSENVFRAEIRAWLEENCPASMRTPMVMSEAPWGGQGSKSTNPDTQKWLERASARGLVLPTVPKEYGGAGLNGEEELIYWEEIERLGARVPHSGVGPLMLAPTIMHFGTDEQKREFVTPISRGEVRWVQGFSEPGAGSDLASLQMRCERDGDEYVLNGQKIWSSFGDVADWMIALVRSDPDATPRQAGISFVLVDLKSPGVTVRPLRLISGDSEFCETFFDDVRVPVSNRIGPEHGGWTVTKHFLVHDRLALRHWPTEEHSVALPALWKECGPSHPELHARAAANELDHLGIDLLRKRIARREAVGGDVSHFSNVLKYAETEHTNRRWELATLLLEERGTVWSGDLFDESDRARVRRWLFSRANTIGAGTSEIVLNVLSKQTLKLPGA